MLVLPQLSGVVRLRLAALTVLGGSTRGLVAMALFWTLVVAAGVIALAIGVFLGAMPLRNDAMSEPQQKYSQLVGMLAFGFFVVLVILRQDTASWVLIGGLVVGFAIAKIPTVSKALSARFAIFRVVKKPATKTRRPTAKKR